MPNNCTMKACQLLRQVFLLVMLAVALPLMGWAGGGDRPDKNYGTPTGNYPTRSLASVLDERGYIRKGASGSFNVAGMTMRTDATGKPFFTPEDAPPVAGTWSTSFATGVSGQVNAIAVVNSTSFFIGGNFASVAGVTANNVAFYNAGSWSALGTGTSIGTNGEVRALAMIGTTDLIVGGLFVNAGGVASNNIARWNISTSSWVRMRVSGSNYGLNGAVNALAVTGSTLTTATVYAGGAFTTPTGNSTTLNRVVRITSVDQGTVVWNTMGSGVNAEVFALALQGTSDLYVGGSFTSATNTSAITANRIARWNITNSTWNALTNGTANGVNNTVRAIAINSNNSVYLGGDFTALGTGAVGTYNYLARWTPGTTASAQGTWNPLTHTSGNGTSGAVYALAINSNANNVAIGGQFTAPGSGTAGSLNYLAMWVPGATAAQNGTMDVINGTSGNGTNGLVDALAFSGNSLVAGGNFTTVGDITSTRIAITSTSLVTPTIGAWAPLSGIVGGSITLSPPTSSSTGAFSFTSSNNSVATVSGNIVNLVGAGSATITATQAATADFAQATATTSLTVSAASPTLSLAAITKTYGDAAFSPTPVSNSTGAYTYASSNPLVATVFGSTITIVGAGSTTITVNQAATANYTAGSTTATLTVNKATLTVAATSTSKVYGAALPALEVNITGYKNGESASVITGTYSMSTTATQTSNAGSFPITVDVSSMSAANYTIVGTDGTLTVNKAVLTVTADNVSRAYGSNNPTFTSTIIGYVLGETSSDVTITGTPTLSTTATQASNASTYPITVSVTGMSATNYSFTGVSGTLTVTKVPLTATVANASRAYGAANPAFALNYSGFVNGQTDANAGISGAATFTTSATATSPLGIYPVSATVGSLSATNYSFETFNDGTLTINKAVLTVTAADASRTYGAANPTFTATYSGFVNGDNESVLTGAPSLTTTATGTTNAGTAIITAAAGTLSADNYSFAFVNGTLTINKAVLTVTAADASRTYGAANPTFTATYSGFVNGETSAVLSGAPSLTTTATATTNAGNATITVAQGTLAATNYNFSFVNGTLAINKAVLTVTAANASRTYGAANPSFTATYGGFVNGETSTVISGTPSLTTTAVATTPVGTATITAAQGSLSATNYSFGTFNNGTLTITKAVLTVTANNASRTYGAANPTFTATYGGFVNGETSAVLSGAPSLTTTAVATTTVGTATITAAVGTLSAANYSFGTFNNGTLTITQAPLTVTADNKSKTYGAANPALSISYNGFVNGETTTVLSSTPSVTTAATTASGAGTYPITFSSTSITAANYALTFNTGTLTVNKAVLTLTADDKSKVYGAALPAFTYTVAGLVGNDKYGTMVTGGDPVLTTAATATSAANIYTISVDVSGLSSTNYQLVPVSGVLTITRAPLTVTAVSRTIAYTGFPTITGYTVTYSGFVNGETAAGLGFSPTFSGTSQTAVNVGTGYTIIPGGISTSNYSITYVGSTLAITRANLTVTADNKTKTYDGSVFSGGYTASYSGFVNGETAASLGLSPTFTGTAQTATGAGTYTIIPGGVTLSNYTVSYANGSLTIDKAPLTVTVDNKSRAYGAANPTFTVSYSGFVNGQTAANAGITGQATLSTTATVTSSVGTYPITATAGTLSATNYSFTGFTPGTLTVGQVALTIAAEPKTKLYGAANPEFTYTVTGFVNGDGASVLSGTPVLTTSVTEATGIGAYPITITGSVSATNYTISYSNNTLTVNRAPLTVTANNAQKTYNGQAYSGGNGVTYSGFVNSEDASVLGGTLTYAGSAQAAVNAGTYTITPAGLTAANYTVSFVSGTLIVARVPLTVTADNKSRNYGAANPAFTASYSGFVNGETSTVLTGAPSLTTTAIATTGVGTATITAAVGTLNATNYSFGTFNNGTLTINKAVLTVTANNASRAYGAANPTFTATYSGFVNSETSTVLSGSPSLTTTADATTPVGTATIMAAVGTLNAANYSFGTFNNGTLTITKAVLTVTANNASRTYGAANPTFTATYNGFVNGDNESVLSGAPSLTTTASATTGVGTATITAAVGTLSAANYSFGAVNGTLTITKAPLTVTVDNKSRTYGAANPTFTVSYSGFVNGQTAANAGITGQATFSTTATVTSSVGTYPITATAGTLTATNYSFTGFTAGTLTVGQAALTIAAESKTKVYGAANPALTYTVTGFVNGDGASVLSGTPVLATSVTEATGIGAYPINITGSVSATNYTISYTNSSLTVTRAPLTVTAADASRTYGAANPTFTATYSGFVNGETSTVFTGAPLVSTTATATTPVGTATINAALGTLSAANYSFAFVNGTLTINKAPLTVTAADASRTYGAANPAFTTTYNGFVNGEKPSVLSGAPLVSTTATATTPVGTATINAALGTLSAANYSFAFVNGTLTINKAPLTVTAANASRTYGAANPTFTASYSGFVNGETSTVLSGAPSLTTTADATTPVGTATITAAQGTLSAANYSFTAANGTLTITKALLTVKADDKSKTYGAANPALTATITGFVNGDDASDLNGAAALNTDATANSHVGAYSITASVGTLTSGNYSFSFQSGELTINKAALTVKADNKSKNYGAANPELTATITGFENGDDEADLSGAAVLNTDAAASSNTGKYAITASQGTLASNNYSFNFQSGELEIKKANLTVQADDKTRKYGQSNPVLTATITGFVNGDDKEDLSGAPALSTSATSSSVVNTYDIVAALGSLASDNYNFDYANGTLTVEKATLTVTAEDKSKIYGQPNPQLVYTLSGFVNNETASVVSGAANLSTTATQTSDAGNYPITATAGDLTADNYAFSFVDGTLTVGKASASLSGFANISKTYGDAAFTLVAPASNGSGAFTYTSSDASVASISGNTVTINKAGSVTITAQQAASANYEAGSTTATLTIAKANATIQPIGAVAKTVGDPAFNPAPSSNSNGAFSYSSSNTTVATVSGSQVLPAGSGTAVITVSQAAIENYNAAQTTFTLTVAESQVITQAPSLQYSNSNYTFTAGQPIATIGAPANSGGAIPKKLYATVASVAGNGTAGFADGIPGSFNGTFDVDRDASGNIYVTDVWTERVRKITPAGVVSTLYGTGTGITRTATLATNFNRAMPVAVDNVGNVYFANAYKHTILKISPSGSLLATFGATGVAGSTNGTASVARFNTPTGLVADASGNVYVADFNNHRIRKIDAAGNVTTLAGGTLGYLNGTGTAARFNWPSNITITSQGNLVVLDLGNGRIRQVTPSGDVTLLAGDGSNALTQTNLNYAGLKTYCGLSVDAAGNILVSDAFNNVVRLTNKAGQTTVLTGSGTAGYLDGIPSVNRFNSPMGVYTHWASGEAFVADYDNNRVRKFSTVGYTISPALPQGLVLNADGTISGTPVAAMAPTTFTITAANAYGIATTTITIAVTSGGPVTALGQQNRGALSLEEGVDAGSLMASNLFSPNGSAGPRELKVNANKIGKLTQFRVYDLSGRVVFSTQSAQQGWNGYINGSMSPAGTYLWEVSGTDKKGKPFQHRGKAMMVK